MEWYLVKHRQLYFYVDSNKLPSNELRITVYAPLPDWFAKFHYKPTDKVVLYVYFDV